MSMTEIYQTDISTIITIRLPDFRKIVNTGLVFYTLKLFILLNFNSEMLLSRGVLKPFSIKTSYFFRS